MVLKKKDAFLNEVPEGLDSLLRAEREMLTSAVAVERDLRNRTVRLHDHSRFVAVALEADLRERGLRVHYHDSVSLERDLRDGTLASVAERAEEECEHSSQYDSSERTGLALARSGVILHELTAVLADGSRTSDCEAVNLVLHLAPHCTVVGTLTNASITSHECLQPEHQ